MFTCQIVPDDEMEKLNEEHDKVVKAAEMKKEKETKRKEERKDDFEKVKKGQYEWAVKLLFEY